ncbi:MAG: hypothetical protein LBS69_08540 [Prevotellaceae bacterium]|jgi:hypothetical protein|nr:hypothetical protein [Prevotellaceae bacterium]
MGHIFRIHTKGKEDTVTHWADSKKISTDAIESIQDPNGETSKKEITSIPSPFARIDLVKNAFAEVVKSGKLDDITIYHKMVSDSLDVGQIFFNFNKYKGFIEILEWNRQNDLASLRESNSKGHKQLAKTYDIFLKQDSETYNFKKMDSIFILKCTHPTAKEGNRFIGATSPATLFFSSANDLSYVSELINFGTHKPFDNNRPPFPLYKRDIEYQKFWHLLRTTNPNFALLFSEMDAYLTENYNALHENERDIINKAHDWEGFENIGEANNLVNVLGIDLKQKGRNIRPSNDFEIDSDHNEGYNPLVLPFDRFTKKLKYVTADWDPNTKTPYRDKLSPTERTLPADGSKYPYLTISDFLEDTIIRMPHEIIKSSFFDGNIDNANGKSYLLPLTDLFFKFFTVEQLKGTMPDKKKMIEIRDLVHGVEVTLRIPIKSGNYITYKRVYCANIEPDIDENNKGAMKEDSLVFALFPNIKFAAHTDAHYRFGLITGKFEEVQKYDVRQKYNVRVQYADPNVQTECVIRNSNFRMPPQCKNFILGNSNFDYIRIICPGGFSGIVIPVFHQQQQPGADQYTFAIDFGTTNTHIEYSVNGADPKPLDITTVRDKQLHLVAQADDVGDVLTYIFDSDFIPEKIGGQYKNYFPEFKFPIRTALSAAANTNWNFPVYPLGHANVAFLYEKREGYPYNRIYTGLKWSNDNDAIKKIKCYIESLFLILRNKVILNDGILSETKIVWFYPVSMTRHRFNMFKKAWESAYTQYFGNNLGNIIPITESVAPYKFYMRTSNNTKNIVSIDIGGGTSDIVIADGQTVKYITSFRFAANSIFGDGYAINNNNGIVKQFKPEITKVLEEAGLPIYAEICNQGISSDIASFFFSLQSNKTIIDGNLQNSVNFNEMLQGDGTQKIIFIFFYAALIYHLAHIMKAKQLSMPRHIAFSGNGSKVIQILTNDKKLLERYTKLIFEKIYGKQYDKNGLTILQSPENPKEVTCKGGIYAPEAQDYDHIDKTKVILDSSDNQSFFVQKKYGDIDREEYLRKTVEEARKFIRFVIDLNNDIPYHNNFGIDDASLMITKETWEKDLETYTRKGLDQKLEDITGQKNIEDAIKAAGEIHIEETFFFYPLNGMLNALSNTIYDKSKQQ